MDDKCYACEGSKTPGCPNAYTDSCGVFKKK